MRALSAAKFLLIAPIVSIATTIAQDDRCNANCQVALPADCLITNQTCICSDQTYIEELAQCIVDQCAPGSAQRVATEWAVQDCLERDFTNLISTDDQVQPISLSAVVKFWIDLVLAEERRGTTSPFTFWLLRTFRLGCLFVFLYIFNITIQISVITSTLNAVGINPMMYRRHYEDYQQDIKENSIKPQNTFEKSSISSSSLDSNTNPEFPQRTNCETNGLHTFGNKAWIHIFKVLILQGSLLIRLSIICWCYYGLQILVSIIYIMTDPKAHRACAYVPYVVVTAMLAPLHSFWTHNILSQTPIPLSRAYWSLYTSSQCVRLRRASLARAAQGIITFESLTMLLRLISEAKHSALPWIALLNVVQVVLYLILFIPIESFVLRVEAACLPLRFIPQHGCDKLRLWIENSNNLSLSQLYLASLKKIQVKAVFQSLKSYAPALLFLCVSPPIGAAILYLME